MLRGEPPAYPACAPAYGQACPLPLRLSSSWRIPGRGRPFQSGSQPTCLVEKSPLCWHHLVPWRGKRRTLRPVDYNAHRSELVDEVRYLLHDFFCDFFEVKVNVVLISFNAYPERFVFGPKLGCNRDDDEAEQGRSHSTRDCQEMEPETRGSVSGCRPVRRGRCRRGGTVAMETQLAHQAGHWVVQTDCPTAFNTGKRTAIIT